MTYRSGNRLRATGLLLIAMLIQASASAGGFAPISQRLADVLEDLDPDLAFTTERGLLFAGSNIEIRDCRSYPYNSSAASAERRLARDLDKALLQGIQCLAGEGPAGRLHPYHEYQAHRLLNILETGSTKTFRCVADRMFANAVATTAELPPRKDALYMLLRETGHPGVVLDTYRIGGLLSTRHSPEVYRDFFKLNDTQIREHLTGSPLRIGGNHRYRDLPALLFHEMVHWLGHEHSAIYPDMAHLYETCCFGGSDYVRDPQKNAAFQASACGILKDGDLWSNAYNRYRQMRQWRFKGYDQLKLVMRESYDR